MCDFILATVSPRRDEHRIRQLAKAALLNWEVIAQPSLQKQLFPGESIYFTTRGHCDCGTKIGAALKESGTFRRRDKDATKLKKQGWSQEKIARWLAEQAKIQLRDDRNLEYRNPDGFAEIQRWVDFIRAAVQGHFADWLGILVHSFKGSIIDESITIQKREWLVLDNTIADQMAHFSRDTLYSVALKVHNS